jgi:hypothetical protein
MLGGWELPMLRLLGRRLVFVFNGSDTRPAWMSGLYVQGSGTPDARLIAREVRRQQRCIRWIERFADEVVCHPLSAQLLTRPFVNHLTIGHPFLPEAPAGEVRKRDSGFLRIVHAPTRPLQKGSPLFRAEVAKLGSSGVSVEYLEFTNRPNQEVLAGIVDSDLVLDQAYSDIPLAGLATESAALGRAVLVGGYGRSELQRFLGAIAMPMDHFVPPEEIGSALEALARDPVRRAKQAAELQVFALQQWNPVSVASRFLGMANRPVHPKLLAGMGRARIGRPPRHRCTSPTRRT